MENERWQSSDRSSRLVANEISFSYYRSKLILDRISISFERGEWLTLLGPNGTGKTTLLKCILQQLTPSGGEVFMNDIPIASLSIRDRAKQIAYVPQTVQVPFALSVVDTVLTGRLSFSPYRYTSADKDIAADVIEKMNLQSLAFRPVNELSGGERQRVWIARALVQEAPLLCMDEPTTGMDLENQLRLLDLIRDLVDRKMIGVLMTLHDLNLASMYSDRIALLYQKQLYGLGAPGTVLTEASIRDVYHVESKVDLFEGRPAIRLVRNVDKEKKKRI